MSERRIETLVQRQETEANRFAAGMLMPKPWFVSDMRKLGDADVEHLKTLCDHPDWNDLTKAFDKGWRPTWVHMERAENLLYNVRDGIPPRDTSNDTAVVLNGHQCTLTEDFMDVLVWGNNWSIHLGHAPSESAEVETYGPCAIDDPEVLAEAMKVLNEAADRLRARIADDLPRDAMKPDTEGRVIHPLMRSEAYSGWYCLHCDGKFTGTEMSSNMWHCPNCSATPIDIFPIAWWKEAVVAGS